MSFFFFSFSSSNGLPSSSRIDNATFSFSFEMILAFNFSPTLYFLTSSFASFPDSSQERSFANIAPSISFSRLQKIIPSLIAEISVSTIVPIGLASLNLIHGLSVNCLRPKLSLFFS